MANKVSFTELNDIPVKDWLGLYSRGLDDDCPRGYFPDCLNVSFDEGQVFTRKGTELQTTKSNIVRYFTYRRLGESSRELILDSSGNFFDSLTPDTPLITNAAFLDFSAVNYLNRAYITFHNRTTGISGTSMYVYEGGGVGTLRLAAGATPASFTLGVATSASSGNIAAGTHIVAVAFESSTGFISNPGPALFTEYEAPGNFAVDLSSIPVGPTGTVARWILFSKATNLYDGNQYGQELFFALRIGNNTATTYSALSFFDDDLIDSADYLFDNLATIPAGVGLCVYNDRLITWGLVGDEHSIWISKRYYPENFNAISGFIQIDPSQLVTGVQNCVEYRKQLYIAKNPGLKVTTDNGNDPNTWNVDDVDPGVGTTCFGLSTILGAPGSNTDRLFIADKLGLVVFEAGTLQKPELTWAIKSIWDRINKIYFNKIQVVNDPENSKIYISLPLDAATSISHILVGDYSKAVGRYGFLVPTMVKWALWQFPWTVSSISIDYNSAAESVFKVSGTTGGIYIQTDAINDAGTRIQSYVKTYFAHLLDNYVHQFCELALRVLGTGDLEFTLYGEDNVKIAAQSNLTLSSSPGREYLKLINFTNEKMSVKIGMTTTINNNFNLWEMTIRAIPVWRTRPR